MATKIVALKEEGTHPPGEGILARFAQIHAIKSAADVSRVISDHPDVVLVDIRMPNLHGKDIVQNLREQRNDAVIMLLDFKQAPGALRRQLNRLATVASPRETKALDIPHIVRILRISQEALSRILNVSTKTAHRWMKGTRPRPKPELERLSRVVSLLLDTLPNEDAIRNYLNHPNAGLNGDTPLNLLSRGDFDKVTADLHALREGVYV
jgi:DNA-binding NarL/FixJ family response regulator